MITSVSILSILSRTFVSATPLALCAVGGIFGEKSGISNIGLEGTMTFGAFFSVLGSYLSGNPWVGLLCGTLMGLLVSLFHAFFCITLKVNQCVMGIAINILASTSTVYLSNILFHNKGFTPNVAKLPDISIPGLCELEGIGGVFSNISPLTIAAVILPFIMAFVLYRTKFGLHVLAVGEAPKAAFVMGVRVQRVQYVAVAIGGLGCALGGSFLSISYLSQYVRDMVAGRGFIAIAAILFGRYNPVGVLLATLFFGLADAMQMSLQGTTAIPNEIILCIPYLLTIVAVSLNQYLNLRVVPKKQKG